MKLWQMMEILDTPVNQRRAMLEYFGVDMPKSAIWTFYHVTEADRAEVIRSKGLVAGECQQGRVTRQKANYLFIRKNDADNYQVHEILGITNPVILKIKISGEQMFEKVCADNMWNSSFEDFDSAIMFLDNIDAAALS